jgi:hypothetical protein
MQVEALTMRWAQSSKLGLLIPLITGATSRGLTTDLPCRIAPERV